MLPNWRCTSQGSHGRRAAPLRAMFGSSAGEPGRHAATIPYTKLTRIPFPDVAVSEVTVFRPHTAPGLFVSRHLQAMDLLALPDLGDGDLDREARKMALEAFVGLRRPLGALVLFLHVVALEDYVRDLGARLSDVEALRRLLPSVVGLGPQSVVLRADRPFGRLDKDPLPLSDHARVNERYNSILGVEPFPLPDIPQLADLALIRHTVAHHAARVRPIDVPRFQYWEMRPGQLVNPPVPYVRQLATFLYHTGANFERAVRLAVFRAVLPQLPSSWVDEPPELLRELIELFNWFGLLPEDNGALDVPPWAPEYEQAMRHRQEAMRHQLVERCVAQLVKDLARDAV